MSKSKQKIEEITELIENQNQISLTLGDVQVMLAGNEEDLDLKALWLLDILIEKYRAEMKYAMNPDREEIEKTDEIKKDESGSKKTRIKSKTRQFQSLYA